MVKTYGESDPRRDRASKAGQDHEKVGPKHALVDVLVRADAIDAKDQQWHHEQEPENNPDELE